MFRPGQFFPFGSFVILAIIFADQYTKWLVLETMLRQGSETPSFASWFLTKKPLAEFMDQQETYNTVVVSPFLNLTMVWNKGISFGMLDGGGNGLSLALIGLALLASLLLLMWLAFARQRFVAWGLSLVVGGALGNVIDRIRFGAVADFIDVHVSGRHWPAFNLADSCIVVGAILLTLHALFARQPKRPAPRRA